MENYRDMQVQVQVSRFWQMFTPSFFLRLILPWNNNNKILWLTHEI